MAMRDGRAWAGRGVLCHRESESEDRRADPSGWTQLTQLRAHRSCATGRTVWHPFTYGCATCTRMRAPGGSGGVL